MSAALIALLGVCVTLSGAGGEFTEGTVYTDHGVARFEPGKMDPKGAAYGQYNDTVQQTGWGVLHIKAGHGLRIDDNNEIMYAAGVLEGAMTAKQIQNQYRNLYDFFLRHNPDGKKIEAALRTFFKKQDQWMRDQIKQHAASDPYWQHMSYILSQFDGLWAGYRMAAGKNKTHDEFIIQFLNAVGDVIDLRKALVPESQPDFSKMTKKEIMMQLHRAGHCSALIKVLGAYENLFMSHSSWFTYQSTYRIYKYYDFNIDDPNTAAKKISFSSYPGFLESLDDFYLMSSGMVLLQTTNNVFNTKLYESVTPASLLAWQRVRLANMMADNGKQWADILRRDNSGTYNNQYMVIDLKRIKLKQEIQDDALWVVEQIPTLVEGADQSEVLRAGYWPSYNVPFFESIYNKSGYPAMVKRAGLDTSYQLAPRAKIFRRDAAKVLTLDDMKAIMRYNDYKHDPYSELNPCNTICCRGDLETPGMADGCYDTKVADYQMALNLEAVIINGPTRSHGLPAFSWTGEFANVSHIGLPTEYKFPWVNVKPLL